VIRSVLYGVRNANVEQTADALAERLGCEFRVRDSHYLGIYQKAQIGSTQIRVVAQPDPEGEPLEDGFEEYHTLIYVEVDGDFPTLDGVPVAAESVTRLREHE
jgi:hypothetical protein